MSISQGFLDISRMYQDMDNNNVRNAMTARQLSLSEAQHQESIRQFGLTDQYRNKQLTAQINQWDTANKHDARVQQFAEDKYEAEQAAKAEGTKGLEFILANAQKNGTLSEEEKSSYIPTATNAFVEQVSGMTAPDGRKLAAVPLGNGLFDINYDNGDGTYEPYTMANSKGEQVKLFVDTPNAVRIATAATAVRMKDPSMLAQAESGLFGSQVDDDGGIRQVQLAPAPAAPQSTNEKWAGIGKSVGQSVVNFMGQDAGARAQHAQVANVPDLAAMPKTHQMTPDGQAYLTDTAQRMGFAPMEAPAPSAGVTAPEQAPPTEQTPPATEKKPTAGDEAFFSELQARLAQPTAPLRAKAEVKQVAKSPELLAESAKHAAAAIREGLLTTEQYSNFMETGSLTTSRHDAATLELEAEKLGVRKDELAHSKNSAFLTYQAKMAELRAKAAKNGQGDHDPFMDYKTRNGLMKQNKKHSGNAAENALSVEQGMGMLATDGIDANDPNFRTLIAAVETEMLSRHNMGVKLTPDMVASFAREQLSSLYRSNISDGAVLKGVDSLRNTFRLDVGTELSLMQALASTKGDVNKQVAMLREFERQARENMMQNQ